MMSAYLLVSLHSNPLNPANDLENDAVAQTPGYVVSKFATHDWWDDGKGWKNLLNNLGLIIKPFVLFNLIKPWLKVFPIPHLSFCFLQLITLMNWYTTAIPNQNAHGDFLFSSA